MLFRHQVVWLTHSTTCDETALQVLWLPTAVVLIDPLDYLESKDLKCFSSQVVEWVDSSSARNSSQRTPKCTFVTDVVETALRVLWLPSALLLTDPLDYLWRNCTSSPLTPHGTTADRPIWLPVTKQHFKSFDSPGSAEWPTQTTCGDESTALQVQFRLPPHYRWLTHSTTCDKTALQVLWLPTALPLTNPLDYLWRNCTSSPLTPHRTTADQPTRLPVTKLHFESFDSPPHYRWLTHSTTCDETALQVLWLPTAPPLTNPLDYLWRNCTSSPLTPHRTTADWPTRLPVTKQHFKSFDYPPHHRWPTHSTTCDETALRVLWLPTTLPLTDPLDDLWRNSTSSPLTTHRTTADQPTRLPVTKLHFESFDSPAHYCWLTHSTTCDETALQVLWLPTALLLIDPLDYLWRNSTSSPLTPQRTTADWPTRLHMLKQHFKSFDSQPHYRWLTHSTTCDETALRVLWLPSALLLTDPLDYLWRNCTSSPLTPHGTTADRPTRLPVTKQHFKSFDSPAHYCWLTHSTTCDETALQVLWLPTALLLTLDCWLTPAHSTTYDETALQVLWLPTTLPLTDPLDYLWRNCISSPLTPQRTTADWPTRLPVTKLHFKSFDSPRHYCWLTHLTTCDETALQVLWLPSALLLTDPLDYIWRNSTSSPLTPNHTTADWPTRLPVTKLHFKSFDSPPHYLWPTHSTTCDETALQVLWLPTAPPLTNPLDYLWRNCTSSPLTPHHTTADWPTRLPVTKQHFKSFDYPPHHRWPTHSTTCDETALRVLWLPTALPLTDPLDYLWRNSTSSPLTTHRTTADQPTRLPVTKLHFESFDSPPHYRWLTHSTTCDETALQVLWLPTAPPLTNPLDYLWRNCTSSPLTPQRTTADWPTRLSVTKLHFKSFDSPRHYCWSTHSTTCDETALQVLWLPSALLLTDPLDYICWNSTSSPLTPNHTTADWPTRLPVTKLHFESFDSPAHYCWLTHSTTCDETALQVLWLPTALLLTPNHTTADWHTRLPDPLDYLWRNSTSSPLTPHRTTADQPTRLPVTKQHFKSFDSPPHYRWLTHSTTCDETALQVLWLPTTLPLTDPLDYLWRNCTSSPLTPYGTTFDQPTRLPVTKLHFKSFDSPPHYRWQTHSTTCDETALQVLWLPTAPPLTNPLDYLWRNCTSSPLTPHRTTADWPTRLPVTKQHFKSFDYPPHHRWPTHSTTCDETALRVLWLPTTLPLTDPLDYLWRNSTSSPLTTHRTTADQPTRLPVTKLHFESFDSPAHYCWLTHSTTCDETALQVLWLPTALLLIDPLDYLWRNSTSSPLTPQRTTADWPTRLHMLKQHFKSFDSQPHYRWLTHSTTCDETALRVLWLPSALLLTDPLDYLWRNCTSSPLTPHGTTADRPTRLPVTKQHFKSFDSPAHYCWLTHSTTYDETALQVLWLPRALLLTDPLDYIWRNSTSSPLTPNHTTADWPTRLPVTKLHFKSFDSPRHYLWPTHSTTCDETALQVLWLPTAPPLTNPLDYLWRNCTSSPLTPHHTTADRPTRLPVTKQHFKSFDYPPHHRWPTHSTTCDETALRVLWLPTALPLTDPLDYPWRNSTSSPLTTHRTTADQPTRLPVTKLHFESFDSPPHYPPTCDDSTSPLTAPPLTNPLDYLWQNSTSSPLTPHHTTADRTTGFKKSKYKEMLA